MADAVHPTNGPRLHPHLKWYHGHRVQLFGVAFLPRNGWVFGTPKTYLTPDTMPRLPRFLGFQRVYRSATVSTGRGSWQSPINFVDDFHTLQERNFWPKIFRMRLSKISNIDFSGFQWFFFLKEPTGLGHWLRLAQSVTHGVLQGLPNALGL